MAPPDPVPAVLEGWWVVALIMWLREIEQDGKAGEQPGRGRCAARDLEDDVADEGKRPVSPGDDYDIDEDGPGLAKDD
jgi:hypothetical protein